MARGASPAEVRRAYLRRLVTAHPDKGGDAAAFQGLQQAFAVLSDPEQRLVYDERLERLEGCSASHGSSTSGSGSGAATFGTGSRLSRRDGVIAVVHGQTQGERQQPAPEEQQPAACAGQPAAASAELRAATEAVRAALAAGGPALAAAHLRRAGLHEAAGQLHHALFDAEEAARVQPDSGEAAPLVDRLQAAVQAAAAAAAGTGGGSASPSPGSDTEDAEPL